MANPDESWMKGKGERVRMRMLLEWDMIEPIEGAEEFMEMMELFAKRSPLGGFTAMQTYIERNVPEEE